MSARASAAESMVTTVPSSRVLMWMRSTTIYCDTMIEAKTSAICLLKRWRVCRSAIVVPRLRKPHALEAVLSVC
jgi:hypothetical protein